MCVTARIPKIPLTAAAAVNIMLFLLAAILIATQHYPFNRAGGALIALTTLTSPPLAYACWRRGRAAAAERLHVVLALPALFTFQCTAFLWLLAAAITYSDWFYIPTVLIQIALLLLYLSIFRAISQIRNRKSTTCAQNLQPPPCPPPRQSY